MFYYCMWLDFNTFSCFFAEFLLFSTKGSDTGCDFSLGSFCYSPVYFLWRMHLHSGCYYYDYVVIGVLRPSWFTEILFWIGLLLFKEVKQLIIIIINLGDVVPNWGPLCIECSTLWCNTQLRSVVHRLQYTDVIPEVRCASVQCDVIPNWGPLCIECSTLM